MCKVKVSELSGTDKGTEKLAQDSDGHHGAIKRPVLYSTAARHSQELTVTCHQWRQTVKRRRR